VGRPHPVEKAVVRITVGGIALGGIDCLAALLGGGELRVALFGASTDAAPARLASGHCLEVVPGAGHLFEEPARSTRSPAWPSPGSSPTFG
jgi:hypothetical protein